MEKMTHRPTVFCQMTSQ